MKSLSRILMLALVLTTTACGVEDSISTTSGTSGAKWEDGREIPGKLTCHGKPKWYNFWRVPADRKKHLEAMQNTCSAWKNKEIPSKKLGTYHFTDFTRRTEFSVTLKNTTKNKFKLDEEDCLSAGRRMIDSCDTNTTEYKYGGKLKTDSMEWSITSAPCSAYGCVSPSNSYNPW